MGYVEHAFENLDDSTMIMHIRVTAPTVGTVQMNADRLAR
jgi:hypothetical protein